MSHPLPILQQNDIINAEIRRLHVLGMKNRQIRAMICMSFGVNITSKSVSTRKYRGAKASAPDGARRGRQWHVPTPAPWIRRCEEIVREAAGQYGSSPVRVRTMRKGDRDILARQAAIKAIRAALPRMTTVQIGAFFNTDHSSVLYVLGRHGSRVCMLDRMAGRAA